MVSPSDSADNIKRKQAASLSKVGQSKPLKRPDPDTFRTILRDKDQEQDQLANATKKKKESGKSGDMLQDFNSFASPLTLFQQQAKNKAFPEVGMEATLSEVESQKQISQNKTDPNSEFAQQQFDLSWVNPNAASFQTPSIEQAAYAEKASITSTTNLQELINQMVEKMYVLQSEGKTDTTMQIKYPPIFEGAILTVTSFNTARGEFNISLSNLSPVAKELIDMQQAQNTLKHALEEKGYTLHIMITTTEPETKLATSNTDETANQQQQQQEEDKQEQKRRQR